MVFGKKTNVGRCGYCRWSRRWIDVWQVGGGVDSGFVEMVER